MMKQLSLVHLGVSKIHNDLGVYFQYVDSSLFLKFQESSFIILFKSRCSVPLLSFSFLETPIIGMLALHCVSSIIVFAQILEEIFFFI